MDERPLHQKLETDLEPGTWNLEPETWNLELGTWNLEPGTWNLELGTWNSHLIIRSPVFQNKKKYKVRKIKKIMIVTSNTATTNQPTKSVPTTDSVMASTMSVDEYFDELISKVHEDYADL